MDVRVLRSEPTNENWECQAGRVSLKENGTVPFIQGDPKETQPKNC